jgi:hypothetical protein
MTTIRTRSATIFSLLLVAGCASAPEQPPAPQSSVGLPDWVTVPSLEGGYADTQCVLANASMGILKDKAIALGRAEIASQIEVQVKAMDKTYQNLTESDQGSAGGSTFEAVSKQVTNQKLSGSRASKVDYVDFPDGTQQLCVMVTLDPQTTREIYDGVVKNSGRKLSPQSDEILWQEFKAHKAQQELDAELQKRN